MHVWKCLAMPINTERRKYLRNGIGTVTCVQNIKFKSISQIIHKNHFHTYQWKSQVWKCFEENVEHLYNLKVGKDFINKT